MPKLRKQRRRKVYRYSINRKRLRNRLESVGNISCKDIKNQWEKKKSVATNMREMGLAYDANKAIKFPTRSTSEWDESIYQAKEEQRQSQIKPAKAHVAVALEQEARAPREKLFRLPKGQVEFLSYLMDKHGKDYRAMSLDRRNHYQETWKQIRAKIRRFKKIPEQYGPYLEARDRGAQSDESEELTDDEL